MASRTLTQEEKREKRRETLLNQSIPSAVTLMAVPAVISSCVMSLYNMADTFFVSSLGTAATAAVGVNNSLMQLIQMMGMAIGMGASSYISRLMGAKKDDQASSVLSSVFFLAMALGAVVMTFGLLFTEELVAFLGATEDSIQYSIDYANYILYAAPFMTCVFIMNHCMRAEGSSTFAMLGMVSGSILNCILDPIMIFGYFGCPAMGVAGAAAATAISKIVSFIVLFSQYFFKRSVLNISIKLVSYKRDTMLEIGKIGLPTLTRTGLMTLSGIITNNLAGGFSTSALAAISVVNRIMQFIGSAIIGFGQGFQTVAGFNWGAKRYDRVNASIKFANFAAIVASSCLAIIALLFPEQILTVFSKTDAQVLSVGKLALMTRCAVIPLHASVLVSQSLFTALGKAKQALILSLLRQGICLIPVLVVVTLVFEVNGLAVSQALSDVLSFCVALPMMLGIMKEVKNLHAETEETAEKE